MPPPRNKTGTDPELRSAWHRFCSVKKRTHTDQPASIVGSGGGPFSIHSKLSKIKVVVVHHKTGTGIDHRRARRDFVSRRAVRC